MWLWREWIINAFNANMPFDQFTAEQLAGDLFPDATVQQQVASGFHRNVMTSDEGGLIDAEYRNLYVVDRVATTGVTWMGMTIACAQCHDHKYDPVTQEDFYKLYAFQTLKMAKTASAIEIPIPSYVYRLRNRPRSCGSAKVN